MMKLSDICDYATDRTNISALDKSNYISTENMLPNKSGITLAATLPTTTQIPAYKIDDVLVSNIRPYFKKIWKANFDGGCSADVLVFRAKENINSDFLYYVLSSDKFFEYSMATSKGTKMPRGDKKSIMEFEVPNFDFPTQKKIAEVLSCLDAKIELNRRINENLEQQAQAIFKEWFVDNARAEWKVGKLEDYVTIKRGGSPRPIQNYLTETGLRWLKISDVTSLNTPFVFNIAEHIKEEGLNKTVFLKAGSLVLSNSATPGIPKILAVDSCIHDGWLYFTDSKFSNEFLYLLFQHARPDFLSKGNGSIFINLKTDIVKAYQFPIPDDESLEKFQNIVGILFGEMYQVTAENLKLAEIRDSLLPKLMSASFWNEIEKSR